MAHLKVSLLRIKLHCSEAFAVHRHVSLSVKELLCFCECHPCLCQKTELCPEAAEFCCSMLQNIIAKESVAEPHITHFCIWSQQQLQRCQKYECISFVEQLTLKLLLVMLSADLLSNSLPSPSCGSDLCHHLHTYSPSHHLTPLGVVHTCGV